MTASNVVQSFRNGMTGQGFEVLKFKKDGRTWLAVSFEGFGDAEGPGWEREGTTAILSAEELYRFLMDDHPEELNGYRHESFRDDIKAAVEQYWADKRDKWTNQNPG